jgi:RHS repeat-associated protein
VEFLELGVSYGLTTEWKLYGPDLNGKYGGLNGTGGLEGVSPYLNLFNPVISDYRGNILAEVTNGVVSWSPARPTGYGAVSGYRPVALAHGADVAQSSAWRGRWVDITGYYNIGKRLYDPVSGMWLSYDSTWNEHDPNGMSFCGGNPIGYFDSDGRCIDGAANYLYNGGVAGQALRGIGSYLNGYDNSSAGGGYLTGAAGTIVNELAGMSAPSTYVNGLTGFGNNVSTIYGDSGFLPAASYAVSGWNVGQVVSGAENINLVTGQPVGDAYQQWTAISSGVASTAGVAAGGVGVFNWATAPAATAPTAAAPAASGDAVQLEFPFANGASVQTPGVTQAGETFVRVGAAPQNLKFGSTSLSGAQPGTYAFPQATFDAIGQDPAVLQNLGDLPGSAPQYYRTLQPPAGTPIQRGTVPGGQFGGAGGAQEVIFPSGF